MKAKLARLLAVLVALTMVVPVSAISGPDEPAASGVSGIYIVQLKDAPLPAYEGNIAGLQATSTQMTGAAKLDVNASTSVRYINYLKIKQAEFLTNAATTIGRKPEVAFQYQLAMNGMAVRLTAAEAAELAKLDGVTAVVPDWVEYAQTDNGPTWIGADEIWDGSATGVDTKGEGMIIGIVDTGINMDHPSFAEVGPVDGYVHTNSRGTYYGWCDPTNAAVYTTTVTCNDKLIGVWSFDADLPEDYNGHGSHVGSTAAGNVLQAVVNAPTTAVTRTISGVAPHANIIAYSIEGTPGSGSAPGSSIIAAFDQVIADGVDVVNYSFGGSTAVSPWTTEGLTSVYVRSAGIFMATSAGNTGPTPGSVSNKAAPWYLVVANSTHDRKLENGLLDMEGGVNPPADMMGLGFSTGYGPAPIVYAGWYASAFPTSQVIGGVTYTPAQLASLCLLPFPADTFDGEIVVCDRGVNARVDKGANIKLGGAGGMALANTSATQSLNGDAHYLPAVHLAYAHTLTLRGWLTNTVAQTATIMGFELNIADANGDIMAASSSRGPSSTAPMLLKPDVTAPGTDILAAVADGDNMPNGEAEFDFYSGTSMASPHAAGAAALVMKLHPDWTIAEVQSALMSTALSNNTRPVKENGTTLADPFDVGAGRIDVAQAAQAGFVLHQSTGGMWNANPAWGGDPTALNLASLANDHCIQGAPCVWTRTLRGVITTTWEVSVVNPTSVTLTVEPTNFTLTPGATQVVTITADVAELPVGNWAFGKVQFTPDGASDAVPAHFPVALKTTFAVVPAAVGTETGDAAGSLTVSGIQVSSVITELIAREYGLVQPTLTMEYLNQDSNPANYSLTHNPADGLLVVTAVVTDTDQRFVAEILSSTSEDLDLYIYNRSTGSFVCQSATGAVLEYCSVNNPPAGMYYIIVQNYAASAGVDPNDPMTWDPVVLATAVVPGATSKLTAPTSDNFMVTGPSGEIPSGQVFDVEVNWDFTVWKANNFGVPNVWYGTFDLGTDPAHPGNIGTTSVDIVHTPAVRLEKTVTAATPVLLGDTVTYTLKLYAEEAATVWITDVLPSGVIGTDVYTTVVVPVGTLSGIPVWMYEIPVVVGSANSTLYGQTIINTAYLGWAGTVQSASASFTVDLAKIYLPLVMRAYTAP